MASQRIVDLLVTLAVSSKLQKRGAILYGLSFVKSLLRHREPGGYYDFELEVSLNTFFPNGVTEIKLEPGMIFWNRPILF